MTPIRAFCAALLLLHGLADFGRAQQPSPAPSQSPSPPPAEEKQRTAKQTKKELEHLACGPSHVHLVYHLADAPQTLPEPPPDKGLIYVIRTRKNPIGGVEQANFAMDGKWVGVNHIGNYFYLEADPGPHYFCLKYWGGPPVLLSMVVEKAKTYYLLENDVFGGISIDLIDEKEGKGDVAKYHRSSFEVKQKK